MFSPIKKLLTCLVVFMAICSQLLGVQWLMQGGAGMWDHDGHHHAMRVVANGDFLVVTLSHSVKDHFHEDSDHDAEDDDEEDSTIIASLSTVHAHPDHVLALGSSKLSSWEPTAVVFTVAACVEVSYIHSNEMPLTCMGEGIDRGVAGRPPPWDPLAWHRILRATVMMV